MHTGYRRPHSPGVGRQYDELGALQVFQSDDLPVCQPSRLPRMVAFHVATQLADMYRPGMQPEQERRTVWELAEAVMGTRTPIGQQRNAGYLRPARVCPTHGVLLGAQAPDFGLFANRECNASRISSRASGA